MPAYPPPRSGLDVLWGRIERLERQVASLASAAPSRPPTPVGYAPVSALETTTSATWVGLWRWIYVRTQQPRMVVHVRAVITDGSTTGQIRVVADGVEVDPDNVADVTGTVDEVVRIGPLPLPGAAGDELDMAVQAQVTAGAGSIGTTLLGVYAWPGF